jgi:hypothetical protein
MEVTLHRTTTAEKPSLKQLWFRAKKVVCAIKQSIFLDIYAKESFIIMALCNFLKIIISP